MKAPKIMIRIFSLWSYWLGFTLGQLILWPFDMANAGVLVGLYLGSMVPLLRNAQVDLPPNGKPDFKKDVPGG